MVKPRTLGVVDYGVLILSLLVSLAIGIYFRFSGGKQKTTQEYLLGDRKQRVLPVAVSLMASCMSAITMLGVTAEVYMFGTLFLTVILTYIVFTAIAAYLYLPVFFKLETASTYEYLEQRFGPRVRLAASLLFSLQMVLYMGVVLYAPAIALEALTHLSRDVSILVVGGVCTIYSTIGGIKAIIWTDVFQSGLMYLSLFSVVGIGIWKHGGLTPILSIAQQHDRIEFFNFNPDPTVRHTTWNLAIGGGFTFLFLYGVNQTQVQRYLTMKDHKTAVKSLWVSLPFLYLLIIFCGLAGLSIFSIYYTCDPISSGRIKSLDQLMPLFVMDMMGEIPGLSGLFVAGIFSASLSSVSPCVNSLAAVTVEDYIKPLYRLVPKTELTHTTALIKCLVLTYGIISVAVAFLSQHLGGLLQAGMSIMGIVGGPLLGTFTLGMFVPPANEPGALTGMIVGLVTSLWLGFGGPKPRPTPLPLSNAGCSNATLPVDVLTTAVTTLTTPNPIPSQVNYPFLYRISYLLYVVLSFCVTLVVGYIVSHIARLCGLPTNPLNPDHFSPPVASYVRRKYYAKDMVLQQQMLEKNDVVRMTH